MELSENVFLAFILLLFYYYYIIIIIIIIITTTIIIPVSIDSITEMNGLIDEKYATIKTGYYTTFSKSFEDTMQYSLT